MTRSPSDAAAGALVLAAVLVAAFVSMAVYAVRGRKRDEDALGKSAQLFLLANANVEEDLGVGHHLRRQIGELAAGVGHHAQHAERGRDPVAGIEMVGEDDVTRLLAADRQVPFDHFFHDVLVAHGAPDQLDVARLQRQLQADVAHDGRDDAVALEAALRAHVSRAQQQDGVAVYDPYAWWIAWPATDRIRK